MKNKIISNFFHLDALATIMIVVILVIGLTVTCFSSRYMKGDYRYYSFLGILVALITFLSAMVSANNLFLFLLLWGINNTLLIKLMVHESQWLAAQASGILTAKTFLFGFICIALGFYFLHKNTNSFSIYEIVHTKNKSISLNIALILIFLGSMTQSGLWPFHRWLISSLNSPTPISAIMHAGLVNGGGFLLARFSPLYFNHPIILVIIFFIGLFSAITGTLWKLMQHDVKRMLACSTMGQMGFMFAQCGLGLFPAAIAHLCFHGFFKANLFLSSPGIAREKRFFMSSRLKTSSFLIALTCALWGSTIFSLVTHINYYQYKTNIILTALFFIACTQSVLSILFENNIKNIIIGFFISNFFALIYAMTLKATKTILHNDFSYPLPKMNIFYDTGLIVLILCWLIFLFLPLIKSKKIIPDKILLYIYMKVLNASQPSPKTITSSRKNYSFE